MQKADNKLIIGKTGSGKSCKVVTLTADADRVLYYDTVGKDYRDGVMFYDYAELCRFWHKVYREKFRMIYRPVDPKQHFDEICKLVYQCGNMTFVVEELDTFCGNRDPQEGLNLIMRRGRHKDIHFIGVTQRPFWIIRTITAMATEIFVFRVDEPRDIQYLKERIGIGIVERITALNEYEYVLKKDDSDEFEVGKDELSG